jgi:hypothetical protein
MPRARLPLLVPLLLILGCNGTGARCQQPLADYCQGPCQNYEQAVAQLRGEITPGCSSAGLGTCDNRRFVRSASNSTSYTKFFDTNGQLVGVSLAATYAAFCGGNFFQQEYGDPPPCTNPVLTEDLCATPDGGTDGP